MPDFNLRSRSNARIEPLAMFPPSDGEVIDISGGDHTISNPAGCTRIWIATGGNLTVRLRGASADLTYTNIPDSFEFVGNVTIVRDTTTCADMVADWPDID